MNRRSILCSRSPPFGGHLPGSVFPHRKVFDGPLAARTDKIEDELSIGVRFRMPVGDGNAGCFFTSFKILEKYAF